MSHHPVLDDFHPVVRRWFTKQFGDPSPPQIKGWPEISAGRNSLILAPTGSGKTLAAFLWAINHLVEQHLAEELPAGVRILYVSPLKALNNDVHRNLDLPLSGIRAEAVADGIHLPEITTAVRTGDTPQSKRTAMLRNPPDILITTPESLYLMLTSKQARKMFSTVQYVIVDEIHSICNNKRGVHLSLTLERLQHIAEQEFIRIGLSATQRPLDQIAAFLGGKARRGTEYEQRPVSIVDAGQRKEMDLLVRCAPPDFSDLPAESVWPMVFAELLEQIRLHRTTLIFVNNRRLAERVAAKLNEMLSGDDNEGSAQGRTFDMYAVPRMLATGRQEAAPLPDTTTLDRTELVQAYHGSMSRTAREQMESDLKAGNLRCLVTTSALELGIDIGSVDLVIQLQSPKGVARGLQRVGRSGHVIAATSKGRIFPTFKEDLVESAVVAQAMQEHDVEQTVIPRNCLDVLAQQIVAMVSVEDWDVDDLFDLVRQSYCYTDLSGQLYTGVLQMLGGRYTNEMFRDLRARISWDKTNNTLRALPGSSQLAITSGGTIADKGYFGVYLEDGKTKVGEVDEEFVYESRAGDTFILGSSVWRMIEIDANRITVTPAPGAPARMPFWRGEGIGRSFGLSMKVGEFRKMMDTLIDSPDCLKTLQREFPIDSRGAWNIEQYFLKQKQVTGLIPHKDLLLVEGFRDEIGDPRIVIHSCYGRRVNGLLGLLFARRLHDRTGVEPQLLYNDDGILLRCPDIEQLPLNLLDELTMEEAENIVLEDLLSSPLFGAQFRMNAARALLLRKIAPGKRTPLWLQRLKAKDLLSVVRQYSDFPIVIETIRDVLHDVLDFDHFKETIRRILEGTLRVETVTTEVPSPFAASLLFDFIQVYMYEWDEPKSDKMSRFLEVNRELLAGIVDLDSMNELLRPEAITEVEQQLQHAAEGYKARSPEELFEILLRVGDLSDDEVAGRSSTGDFSFILQLKRDGRAVRMSFPTGDRWVAAEELPIYSGPEAGRRIVDRYIRHHGPVRPSDIIDRYGFSRELVEAEFDRLESAQAIVRGRFRRGWDGEQLIYKPNLERIHRQTLTILRKEITPAPLDVFMDFLMRWQGVDPASRRSGQDGIADTLEQLQGLPLPAEIWEREILMRRISQYSRDHLFALTQSGAYVWTGAGAGKLTCFSRGHAGPFTSIPSPQEEATLPEPAKRVLAYLRQHGASFFNDIRAGTRLSLDALNSGIAMLLWHGYITNDQFVELLSVKRSVRMDEENPIEPVDLITGRRNPHRFKAMQTVRRAIKQVPGYAGRWSLVHVPGVLGEELTDEGRIMHQAEVLLLRYGIVAKEFYKREELLPWPSLSSALQRMEMRGEIRRGYFVEGLSGMQYALPAAVDELRRVRSMNRSGAQTIFLNACDPANPAGTGITMVLPTPSRLPSNYVAFAAGAPVLVIESNGTRMFTGPDAPASTISSALEQFTALIKLPDALRPFRQIVVETCNGERAAQSTLTSLLDAAGFRRDAGQTMQYDGYP